MQKKYFCCFFPIENYVIFLLDHQVQPVDTHRLGLLGNLSTHRKNLLGLQMNHTQNYRNLRLKIQTGILYLQQLSSIIQDQNEDDMFEKYGEQISRQLLSSEVTRENIAGFDDRMQQVVLHMKNLEALHHSQTIFVQNVESAVSSMIHQSTKNLDSFFLTNTNQQSIRICNKAYTHIYICLMKFPLFLDKKSMIKKTPTVFFYIVFEIKIYFLFL